MAHLRIGMAVLAAFVVLPACSVIHPSWDNDSAGTARKLEVQVDKRGKRTEVEYHINPSEVPQAVRDAMDRLHPGGPFDDAEKEAERGVQYYELSRTVKGMEVEAMFTVDGKLHSEEIQVAASAIPANVREAAMAAVRNARVDKWEEIRDGDRKIVAYHVKMSRGTDKFKVTLTTGGKVDGIYREVPAEIEVPVSG